MPSKVAHAEIIFKKHIIKTPKAGAMNNSVPNMVLLCDVDNDDNI